MKTIENWLSGMLGKGLIIFGIITLFGIPLLGLVMIITGFYLNYKSKSYVHN